MLPLLAGIAGTELSSAEEALFRRVQPAGYILFSRNIESGEQTRRLTDSLYALSEETPFLTIDQEGGRVVRTGALGWMLPSASCLAKRGDSRDIVKQATLTARGLRLLGFNMNLAPVLDLGRRDRVSNALPDRCWGTTPNEVLAGACVYAGALKKGGVLTCGKHFPGLGRASVDPHYELPIVDATGEDLQKQDVIPFTSLGEDMLDAVMCAHVFFPHLDEKYPSSLSRIILTDFLRNQLGYEGLVMTDDLDMGAITSRYSLEDAVVLAVNAGNDLAMVCHSHERMADVADALRLNVSPIRREETEVRLLRYSRKMIARRSEYSFGEWEQLLEESRVFYKTCSDSSDETGDQSPVTRY